MKKALISLLLVVMIVSSVGICIAQKTTNDPPRQTEIIRAKVAKLGTGGNVKVEVELFDRSSYVGYISEINDHGFALTDRKGQPNRINYADVKTLHHKSGSHAALWMAVSAGIGVLAAILIIKSLEGHR